MSTSMMQNLVNPPVTTSPILVTEPGKENRGPEMMMACEWHGARDVRCVPRARPHVTDPTDAVVRITTTTVCGSDLHLYLNKVPALRAMERGDVLGHEGVGIVEEVGPNVRNVRPGDRVVVSAPIACGQCFYCKNQNYSCCDTTNPSSQAEKLMGHRTAGLFGYSHITGGYGGLQAEYARVPFADVNLMKLPTSVPDDIGILLSDVACTGWHGVELGEVSAGESVAIWGCGPVGLMAAKWAKVRGARTVVCIDNIAYRLDMAKNVCNADHIIDFDHEDVTERLRELIPGGPDVCIDCVGYRFPKSMRHKIQSWFKLETDALDVVTEMIMAARKCGRIVLIGDYFGMGNQFPIGPFMEKALTMRGGQVYVQKYWHHLLHLIESGQVDLHAFITHQMPFENIAEAYRTFCEHQEGVNKIAVKMHTLGTAGMQAPSTTLTGTTVPVNLAAQQTTTPLK